MNWLDSLFIVSNVHNFDFLRSAFLVHSNLILFCCLEKGGNKMKLKKLMLLGATTLLASTTILAGCSKKTETPTITQDEQW